MAELHRRRQALGQTGRDAVIAVDHMETIAAGDSVRTADLRALAAFVAMNETQGTDRTQLVEARAVFGGVVGRADDLAQQPARAVQAQIVIQRHQVEQFIGLGMAIGGETTQHRRIPNDRRENARRSSTTCASE